VRHSCSLNLKDLTRMKILDNANYQLFIKILKWTKMFMQLDNSFFNMILKYFFLKSLVFVVKVNPRANAGNTKGGSITVLLTSCLTGLESAV